MSPWEILPEYTSETREQPVLREQPDSPEASSLLRIANEIETERTGGQKNVGGYVDRSN